MVYSNDQITRPYNEFNIVLVPNWVYRSIKRKESTMGKSAMEVLGTYDIDIMEKNISRLDLNDLHRANIYLMDVLFGNNKFNATVDDAFLNIKVYKNYEKIKDEFGVSTNERIEQINTLLKALNTDTNKNEYDICISDKDTLVIIMNDGFGSVVYGAIEKTKKFLHDVLNELLKIAPINSVSKSLPMIKYLNLV